MKQRISVRAIIYQEGKILLLQRATGRESILGKYELPGGKIEYGEQPEDTLRRYLHDEAGVHIQTAQLFDAITYIDHDDRDIQYVVIVYNVALSNNSPTISLSLNYSKYNWIAQSKIQRDITTDLTQLVLGILQQDKIIDETAKEIEEKDVSRTTDRMIIFTDGGSRGNPGPSAAGYVIVDANQNVVDEGGEYLGITTNNQAEYHGVRLGMERALARGYKQVEFRIDSMLVVNQMNGIYKIKNRELWPINERIRELMTKFDRISFSHVSREFNQLADGMVNRTLNQHEPKN